MQLHTWNKELTVLQYFWDDSGWWDALTQMDMPLDKMLALQDFKVKTEFPYSESCLFVCIFMRFLSCPSSTSLGWVTTYAYNNNKI